ncbi:MAG: ParB N-terminal domain-containing protein [Candidatus Microsaccharimonas sp.]
MTIAEQGVERLSVTTLLRSEIDVRSEREGGLVEAMVPVELIDQTEVPVDDNHVQELIDSMLIEELKGTVNGQLTPVLLAQVIGKEKLSIIDGFHRSAATERRGSQTVYGTIMPPMTEDEVMDLRILTATSHKTVSFARMYEWVSDSWTKTPWADRVTAAQAFNLASNKKMNGRYLGLSSEETAAIREWASDKCNRWGTVPTTIRKVMTTAQNADPDLMRQARTRSSGHELKTITPDHLTVISTVFPGRFAEQRIIADMATSQNLTIADTKVVLEMIKDIPDIEQIRSTIEITDWSALVGRKPRSETESKETEMKSFGVAFNSQSLNRKFMLAELHIGRLTLDNMVLRGEFAASPLHDPRTPSFSLDVSHSADLRGTLEPVSGAEQSDAIADRIDALMPRLTEVLTRNGLNNAQAAHATRSIGQRLSRDIEEGVLQFASLTKVSTLDGLIKAAISEEVNLVKNPKATHATETPEDTTVIRLDSGLKVVSEIQNTARTTMALVGLMGANVHSVGQVLAIDQLRAAQMVQTVKGRLVSAERSLATE